eukprot:6335615-Alexandrium_andersonii.AAC.1
MGHRGCPRSRKSQSNELQPAIRQAAIRASLCSWRARSQTKGPMEDPNRSPRPSEGVPNRFRGGRAAVSEG